MNTTAQSAQSAQSIQEAVKRCLSRCYEGSPPISEIARFSEELRVQGWDEPDILSVELAVRRVLSQVIDNEIFDNDITGVGR